MTIANEMNALLQLHDGYSKEPQPISSRLDAMKPFVRYGSVPVPEPKDGQVLVRMRLASVNPSDVAFIRGVYGQPRMKDSPAGFEGVGDVVASGGGKIADALSGKRVGFVSGRTGTGTWAEYAVADAAACIPLIDGVRDEDGAAMVVNPLTAAAMFDIVRDSNSKSFIVTAGASQLCKLIIGLAHDEDYRAIAIVRRSDQIEKLKALGAAHVLDSGSGNFREELAGAIRQEKPRIFLDALTGPVASTVFQLMPKGARWIIYGRLDLDPPQITEPGQLIFMGKKVEGFWLAEWLQNTEISTKLSTIRAAQQRFADGRWKTDVTAIVPLEEAMAKLPGELAKPNGKVFVSMA